jgi:hypothetical protein
MTTLSGTNEVVLFIERETLEAAARILGPESGFAQALAAADSGAYGTDPVFCRPLSDPGKLIVAASDTVAP